MVYVVHEWKIIMKRIKKIARLEMVINKPIVLREREFAVAVYEDLNNQLQWSYVTDIETGETSRDSNNIIRQFGFDLDKNSELMMEQVEKAISDRDFTWKGVQGV